MGTSFVLNLFLGASLSLVWGLLNVMQGIVHVPIYGQLKFPGTVLIMNEIMLKIAAFKLLNTKEWFDSHLYDLPEEDSYSPSFGVCGYDGTLLVGNASSTIWLYKANLAILICIYGPLCLINRRFNCSGKCDKTQNKC